MILNLESLPRALPLANAVVKFLQSLESLPDYEFKRDLAIRELEVADLAVDLGGELLVRNCTWATAIKQWRKSEIQRSFARSTFIESLSRCVH